MSNALLRPFPLAEHPLHDRCYRLPTPPIDDLYTLITEALDRRRPGMMVYGRSRLGKTTAIAYIESLLRVERAHLPVIVLRCRFKRVPSEIAFFSNVLLAVRHKAVSGRDTELRPLLARTDRAQLIGTVANRTLLHLHLSDGDTRVVELLWRDHEGAWLIEDARVFSLIAGE